MKNVKLKLTVLGIIVIIVAGIIFIYQNFSEQTLVIFGSQTIALPVALWLMISAIAGLITSIVLQFLLGVYSRPDKRSQQWEDEADEPDGDFEFPETTESANEGVASSTRFNAETKAGSVANSQPKQEWSQDQDWESPPEREDWNALDNDWNIEEPPKREINPRPDNFYEVPNRPEKTSQQGSVYSYRYRPATGQSSDDSETIEQQQENDNNDDEPNPSPNVYEANYRVIRPPLWNLPDAEENWDEQENDTDQR